MKNVFFPDEEISRNDLYFVCYMIERIARHLKQPNKYVANEIGLQGLREKLSLANVLHSENPLAVVADWEDQYHLQEGSYDVSAVDPEYCEKIPTALQMGKVYTRLILDVKEDEEDYAQAILRVYNNPICEIIDDYNGSAYYEPSPFIARSFRVGNFN